jgi:hypothetical protein
LSVVRLRRGRPEQVASEHVDAHVALVDVELVGRGVALLDDADHSLVGGADDPAVAGGVVQHAGEQGAGVAVRHVRGDQLVERLGSQQGRVAREHDHRRVILVVVASERRHADPRRVARAVLLDLLGERHVRPGGGRLLNALGDLLGAVTHDDDGALGLEPLERVDHVEHHRPATDPVEWLRALGPHARADAGSEDDGGHSHALVLPHRSPCDVCSGRSAADLRRRARRRFRGEDSNPYTRHQKPLSYH